MPTMKQGQELHSRAAQGDPLSSEEQVDLDAWLKAQERAELEELLMTEPLDTPTLQAEIAGALKQIRQIAKRIEQLTTENKQIRHENTILRHQIAQQVTPL